MASSTYWGQTTGRGTIPVKQFTGNGTTNPIDMGFSPGSPYAILFLVDGVPQLPDSYNVNGNQLTPTGAIPLGSNCFVIGHGRQVAIGVPGSGTVVVTSFAPALAAVLLRTDAAMSLGKGLGITKGALTDASTITVDLTLAQAFNVTFGGTTRTLGYPSNLPVGTSAGQWYIDTVNSASGTALTFASGYKSARGSFDTSPLAQNRIWLVPRSAYIIDTYIDNLLP